MPALARIVSGFGAAWATMAVSIAAQVALVPIYLSYWSPALYGLWLAAVSLISLFHIVDTGHQQFMGFEFLKVGADDSDRLGLILWSAMPIALAIGLVQILVVVWLVHAGLFEWIFPAIERTASSSALMDAGFVLVLVIVVFGLFGSVGGILVRFLAPFGYYPRMAWWGTLYAFGNAVAPALVVVSGGGIREAGIGLAVWIVGYNLIIYVDIVRLMNRLDVAYQTPDLHMGMRHLWKSQALVITAVLAMIRTTGARILLAPMAGAAQLAAFSTIRTGSNLALQGVSTLTNPLMPELMQFLRERDQERTEGGFALVWFALVVVMAPAVLILQTIVEPVFSIWTRGQIAFKPMLFALLSLGVLIFTWSQPAMAIVTGNNLLRPQLTVGAGAALITIIGMVTLVPLQGLAGAGLALLFAESFAALCFNSVARDWLERNRMVWPKKSSWHALTAVGLTGASIFAIVALPQYRLALLVVGLTALAVNAVVYWESLPGLIRVRARSLVNPTRRLRKSW